MIKRSEIQLLIERLKNHIRNCPSPLRVLNKELHMSSLLTSFESLTHASSFITALSSVVDTVGSNYIKDDSVRNAIIDTAVEYLQSLKTTNT